VTADVPRQPTAQDKDIDIVRALVRAGVVGPCHRRWREMKNVARRLGCRPEDAIWRVRHGCWSTNDNQLHIQTTLADVIREAATR
jgi:hypothetical protein